MESRRTTDLVFVKHLLNVFIRASSFLYPNSKYILERFMFLLYTSWVLKRGTLNYFKCVPVPDRIHQKLIPGRYRKRHRIHSFENCVLVNYKDLKNLIEEYSLTPVALEYVPENARQLCEKTKRYVEVINTNKLPSNIAYMSETFFYNLKSSLKSQFRDLVTIKICKKTENDCVFGVQYATKIVVALIQTPFEVHQDVVKHCLASHFESAHLLCIGDIFVVNISLYMPEVYYVPGHESINALFFKVQELEGPPYDNIPHADKCLGYLVVKNETTLMQTSIQSFIPCTSSYLLHYQQKCMLQNYEHYSLQNYEHYSLPKSPPSLDGLRKLLIKALSPFLFTKISRSHSIKPFFWLIGPTGSGKNCVLNSLASYLGVHLWNFNCDVVFGKVSGQVEGKLKAVFSKARSFAPCLLVLSDIQMLCKDAEGHEDSRIISLLNDLLLEESELPVIVVATSNNEGSVSPSVARMFLQSFVVPPLTEIDRKNQLKWFAELRGATIADGCLSSAASRSSGFLFSDLEALVAHAVRNNAKSDNQKAETAKGTMLLTWTDFEEALGAMQSAYSDAIGAPKIPAVTWDDVGGLTSVKEEVLRTINAPLHHPELIAAGLRRSGLLLYGPPGTGKTLIAKAVATECGLNFLSVKGPELLNMYVGQSEENVREVFERARAASPCIIFFDELDSLAPNRGRSGDSGGVMDRVVSQLLAEMDGLQKSTHLFVIGATNRPDLIDPALLRPGRFDKLLYVSACDDQESIACVLQALTRKFTLNKDVDIKELTKSIPNQVTGADIYAVCSNAWRNAVRRVIKELPTGSPEGVPIVEVNRSDFLLAISEMNPSVSAADLKYFKNLEQELFGNKSSVLAN